MKSLAQRVKAHREALGLNTTEYAQRVGTSRQNIENVEAGAAKQPRYIGKLAKFMGVSVDLLLGNAVAPAPAAVDAGTPAYLAELAAKLPPALQEKLVAFAELLASPQGERLRFSFSLAEHVESPSRARQSQK